MRYRRASNHHVDLPTALAGVSSSPITPKAAKTPTVAPILKQPDPGVGANRQPAGGTEGPRLCLGLCVWCGLPIGGQSGGADHANLQYPRDEPSSLRDQQPSRRRCPCRGDLGSCCYIREVLDDNGRKVMWPIERQGTHCGPLEETKSVGELSNGGDVSVCKLDSRKRRNQAGSPPR